MSSLQDDSSTSKTNPKASGADSSQPGAERTERSGPQGRYTPLVPERPPLGAGGKGTRKPSSRRNQEAMPPTEAVDPSALAGSLPGVQDSADGGEMPPVQAGALTKDVGVEGAGAHVGGTPLPAVPAGNEQAIIEFSTHFAALVASLEQSAQWLTHFKVDGSIALSPHVEESLYARASDAICKLATWCEDVTCGRHPEMSSLFVVGSERAKDYITSHEMKTEDILTLADLYSDSKRLHNLTHEGVQQSLDNGRLSVEILKRLETNTAATHSLLKVVGQTVNSIRSESTTTPSYARATASSTSKQKPRAASTAPMDVSDNESTQKTSTDKEPSKKTVRVEVPKASPAQTKKPKPGSSWMADIDRSNASAKAKDKGKGKAKAESEPESEAESSDKKTGGNKRPRTDSTASRPDTPSTAPPAAKKARSEQDLQDIKLGWNVVSFDLLRFVPANEQEDIVLKEGQKARAQGPASSAPPPKKASPPAHTSEAGQGKGKNSDASVAKPGGGNRPSVTIHHQRRPANAGAKVDVTFAADVPVASRRTDKDVIDLMNRLLAIWRSEFGSEELLAAVPPVCISATWAVSTLKDLQLEFSSRVPDEFLMYLEDVRWNFHEYPRFDEADPEEIRRDTVAHQKTFVDCYPVRINVLGLSEAGSIIIDKVAMVRRVWHYTAIARMLLMHVRKGGVQNRRSDQPPTRSVADVYEVLEPYLRRVDPELARLLVPFKNTPMARWATYTKFSQSHANIECYVYDEGKAAINRFLDAKNLTLDNERIYFKPGARELVGVPVCGHCYRAGHNTKSCKSRSDVWCLKCPGNHSTQAHDEFSPCCAADRHEWKHNFPLQCPEDHWVCCNCGETGHHAKDTNKCKFLRNLLDVKALRRRFNQVTARISAVKGRARYVSTMKGVHHLLDKGKVEEARRLGCSKTTEQLQAERQAAAAAEHEDAPMANPRPASRQGSATPQPGPSNGKPGSGNRYEPLSAISEEAAAEQMDAVEA